MSANYILDNPAWLGEIPSHWDRKKIGALFTERKVKVSDKEYPPLSVAKIGVVPQLDTAVKTDAGDNRKLVRIGDFVINSRSDRKGSCGISKLDGSVSLINIVLTPRNLWNSGYVHYLLRSQPFSEEYYRNGRGIVADLWTTRYSEMKSIFLPVPPRPEQDQIVRFLDWKVSSINGLINIKRRKIKELNALKKTIVNSAVTHGLSPSAPMKFSGVKWMGNIPAHWQISRIKRHFTLRDERNIKKLSDVNLLSVFSSIGVIPRSEVDDYSSGNKAANADGYKIVHCGDIVVNIILCWMGALGKSDFDGVTSPAYDVYKPDEMVSSKYYHYLFRTKAFTEECYKVGRGIMTMRWRVYSQQFMNINIPIPPSEEQQKIVDYLDRKCMQIDASIGQIEESITALQELKKCLIADAITGKIDVRGIQIPEYEFAEENIDTENDESMEGMESETYEE